MEPLSVGRKSRPCALPEPKRMKSTCPGYVCGTVIASSVSLCEADREIQRIDEAGR